jgi:hypothetical protein
VIQYSWAWDESPSIVVTVNDTASGVEVRHREVTTFAAKQLSADAA